MCVAVGILLTCGPAKCGKSLVTLTLSTAHLGLLYSEETDVYAIGLAETGIMRFVVVESDPELRNLNGSLSLRE